MARVRIFESKIKQEWNIEEYRPDEGEEKLKSWEICSTDRSVGVEREKPF